MSAAVWFFALLLPVVLPAAPAPLDKVKLQLKWHHQFQFAGYYAAVAQGYYRDAGLDVTLLEGKPDLDPARVVLAGGAEFGVGTPDLLLSRAAGKPLVVLGVIFQHSPYIFLARRGQGIDSLTDLAGTRVMIEPQAAELSAYLHREKIAPGTLTVLPHTFTARDLIAGKVAAMSAYATDEPFELEQAGIPYETFSPRASGVDFYGDCFFTTERQILAHPARVRAFYDATLKGWDYAFKHPEEIIDLILEKYGSKKSREALRFEAAQMQDLIHSEIIPVGYMYPGRWEHIMETYQELGMLEKPIPLDGFLYDPNPRPDFRPLYWLAGGGLLCAIVASGILLPIWRLNRRLRREVAEHSRTGDLLRAARDEAQAASRTKMEFLAHISHDLRTPLTAIIMQAELMRGDGLDERQDQEVGTILEAAQHLLGLMNDLLEMGRIESGHLALAREPFFIADVFEPVTNVLSIAARQKGLFLSHSIGPNLDEPLQGDPERLRQILFNLLGNAVKFTRSGEVRIRAERTTSGQLRIEVRDTGPGIPAEALERIFEPFRRGSISGAGNEEGNGLGLAIVKRLFVAMGGSVRARSVPGAGSTFTVELPAGAPASVAAAR